MYKWKKVKYGYEVPKEIFKIVSDFCEKNLIDIKPCRISRSSGLIDLGFEPIKNNFHSTKYIAVSLEMIQYIRYPWILVEYINKKLKG